MPIKRILIMAVTKAKKAEQIEKLSADLKGVNNVVDATFGKLTVNQDFELRKAVRSAGGKYRVVKNKLAGRGLKGVTSIAYTTGDPVALAKAIGKYVTDNGEQFSVKGGVVEGKVVSAKEV